MLYIKYSFLKNIFETIQLNWSILEDKRQKDPLRYPDEK